MRSQREIPQRTSLIVIAIRKETTAGPKVFYNPPSATVLETNDRFIVLGDQERFDKLQDMLRE